MDNVLIKVVDVVGNLIFSLGVVGVITGVDCGTYSELLRLIAHLKKTKYSTCVLIHRGEINAAS